MSEMTKLAENVASLKQISEGLQTALEEKIGGFMDSPAIKELNEKVEKARVEYEVARDNVLKEMKNREHELIKTESGVKLIRSTTYKFNLTDEEKVIGYLEEHNPELVRKAIVKEPALKYLSEETELGKEIEGFSVEKIEKLIVIIPK